MKSMEISKKIENLEKDGDPSLLTFSHQDAEFKISINKAEAKDKAGEFRLSFYITDDQGNKLGSISGLFIAESRTFISFAAKNNAVEEVLGLPHVPKLIKKAISEMISNGLFTKWFSSMHLSPGGKKMYESLKEDTNLSVSSSTEYDGENRYKVTLRSQNS